MTTLTLEVTEATIEEKQKLLNEITQVKILIDALIIKADNLGLKPIGDLLDKATSKVRESAVDLHTTGKGALRHPIVK